MSGIGPRGLKIAGAVGAVLACGASGLVVAASPRPAQAPLQPPVDAAAARTGAAAATADPSGGLSIPPTPLCPGGARSQATRARGAQRRCGALDALPSPPVADVQPQVVQGGPSTPVIVTGVS